MGGGVGRGVDEADVDAELAFALDLRFRGAGSRAVVADGIEEDRAACEATEGGLETRAPCDAALGGCTAVTQGAGSSAGGRSFAQNLHR
ncbi:hypothetical protein CERSUDRAFT_87361 [Gelatoporia subvermispora B]|uniref:Uncharacterized protein n=1 Tax=Ceriporiopsis subvermispora (strain B) TaxID=914234 RepID=M2PCT1_CERS8|nr:hypothetical protein CERSUDRAFT_87361 [Gelatoporia subvermispora B]